MRIFVASLIFCLSLITVSLAREPLVLKLEQTVEISREGNSVRFCVHPADDPESRVTGLMFQKELPELGGMIFDFETSDIVHMWMRNTILPLDMIFIDEAGKIVKIAKDTTPFSLKTISSGVPARQVLEVNAGISDKYKIKAGDQVALGGINCVLP